MIKTKTSWKNLKGVNAWLPELKTLLAEARAAAEQSTFKPRLEVAEFLAGFIQESFPQSEEMDELDAMAERAATDIMLTTVDERLAAIAARTAEYVRLEKHLHAAAERGESAAASIRLKGIQNLIETTTRTILSAKALAASLDDANVDEKKLAALIGKTVAAVEKLRTSVAGLI